MIIYYHFITIIYLIYFKLAIIGHYFNFKFNFIPIKFVLILMVHLNLFIHFNFINHLLHIPLQEHPNTHLHRPHHLQNLEPFINY
jgi:hypothetical protein